MSEIAYYVSGDIACSIHKHESGHLCGYIGLPKAHPWHGKDYDDIDAEVHGGLTYAGSETVALRISKARREFWKDWNKDFNSQNYEYYKSLPRWDEVERDEPFPHYTRLGLWWVGFDCAHAGDFLPIMPHLGGTHRDESFVRAEIDKLIAQACEAWRVGQPSE
jgi:hypothetical protein